MVKSKQQKPIIICFKNEDGVYLTEGSWLVSCIKAELGRLLDCNKAENWSNWEAVENTIQLG